MLKDTNTFKEHHRDYYIEICLRKLLHSSQLTSTEEYTSSSGEARSSNDNTTQALNENISLEYNIDQLVRQKDTTRRPLFKVRWYRFDCYEDNLEPESILAKHLVATYRHSKAGGTGN